MIARHQYRIDPEQSPLNGTDARPPYALADFEAAKEFTDRLGVIASVSDGNFTCEFPWDPGAASNLFLHQRERLLESGEYTPGGLGRLSGRTILPLPSSSSGTFARLSREGCDSTALTSQVD